MVTRVTTHSLADPDTFFIHSFIQDRPLDDRLSHHLRRLKNAARTSNQQLAAGCRPITAIAAMGLECSTLTHYVYNNEHSADANPATSCHPRAFSTSKIVFCREHLNRITLSLTRVHKNTSNIVVTNHYIYNDLIMIINYNSIYSLLNMQH